MCRRRIEDAIEKKQMTPVRINVRMKPHAHGNRNTALDYPGFLAIPDSADCEEGNVSRSIFLDSKLANWACNPDGATWIPESAYKVPTLGRDSTPVSSDRRWVRTKAPSVCGIAWWRLVPRF